MRVGKDKQRMVGNSKADAALLDEMINNIHIFFLRVGWTHVGYSVGVKAIDKVRENSQMIARSATITH